DQPLASHRGQRNEPAHLVEVAQVVAQLRGIDVSEVAAATRSNAQRLFALA
ncbi:MAG: TatD family hydrolase, partial [Dokdonella sp.]|nr:TatD family hydrolase [Dokdonella sp.]